MVRKRAHIIEPVGVPASTPSTLGGSGGVPTEDYDVMTSSTVSILSEAESDLDTSAGSGRSMIAGASSNNYIQGSTSDHQRGDQAVDDQAWYAHLLAIEDLAIVDPPRGRFLSTLQDLVTKKHAMLAAHELSPPVRRF